MRKRSKSKKSSSPKGSFSDASIAEGLLTQLAQRTLEHLRSKLPPDVRPQQMATWILTFLDRAAQPVHVRNRDGKISIVACLDKIERHLVSANVKEYQDIVVPFWKSSDFRILGEVWFELREKAKDLGVDAGTAESIFRHQVNGFAGGSKKNSKATLHEMIRGYGHSLEVWRRLITISFLTARAGRRLTDLEICKQFDFERVPLPEEWENKLGLTQWVAAHESTRMKNRLHRKLSGYRADLGLDRR